MRNKIYRKIRNYELRKFKCKNGHWFLTPIWINYLNCPVFACREQADRIEDITVKGLFDKQENYGLYI